MGGKLKKLPNAAPNAPGLGIMGIKGQLSLNGSGGLCGKVEVSYPP